jgi:hypothetical protein
MSPLFLCAASGLLGLCIGMLLTAVILCWSYDDE